MSLPLPQSGKPPAAHASLAIPLSYLRGSERRLRVCFEVTVEVLPGERHDQQLEGVAASFADPRPTEKRDNAACPPVTVPTTRRGLPVPELWQLWTDYGGESG
jgi:hypothetical protein